MNKDRTPDDLGHQEYEVPAHRLRSFEAGCGYVELSIALAEAEDPDWAEDLREGIAAFTAEWGSMTAEQLRDVLAGVATGLGDYLYPARTAGSVPPGAALS